MISIKGVPSSKTGRIDTVQEYNIRKYIATQKGRYMHGVHIIMSNIHINKIMTDRNGDLTFKVVPSLEQIT